MGRKMERENWPLITLGTKSYPIFHTQLIRLEIKATLYSAIGWLIDCIPSWVKSNGFRLSATSKKVSRLCSVFFVGSIDCTAIYLWSDLIHTTGALYKIGKLVKHIRIIIISDRDDSDMYWVILRRRLRSLHVSRAHHENHSKPLKTFPWPTRTEQNT